MSKADEMFEELGYEIEVIGNGTEYYKECGTEEKEIDFIINVDTSEKEIWIGLSTLFCTIYYNLSR